MAKTASINVRIEPSIKTQAEELYSSFGISLSDAINMFIYQSIRFGGLPFALRQEEPNQTTLEAMQEAKNILNGKTQTKSYKSCAQMFADFDSEGEC